MHGVYVTCVASVDEGQWHIVSLEWSFRDASSPCTLAHVLCNAIKPICRVNWTETSPTSTSALTSKWLQNTAHSDVFPSTQIKDVLLH